MWIVLLAALIATVAAVLRWGGFLDTVDEGRTGLFFDRPLTAEVAKAVRSLRATPWDAAAVRAHATRFSERRFMERLTRIVQDEERLGSPAAPAQPNADVT